MTIVFDEVLSDIEPGYPAVIRICEQTVQTAPVIAYLNGHFSTKGADYFPRKKKDA